MKTRIISAAVGLILFAGVLFFSVKQSLTLLFALALLSGIAAYELLKNTGIVKHKLLWIGGVAVSVIAPFLFLNIVKIDFWYLIVLYGLYVAIVSLIDHNENSPYEIFASFSVPIALTLSFSSIYSLFAVSNMKHFYFALIFAFAWGADTFAYFGGRFFGKHKLAPVISPKKTVEGFIAGIIGSIAVTLIIAYVYSLVSPVETNLLYLIIFSVIFAPVGVLGDLFASLIKRSTGIKDYGNIMPGHGGVMDRFDSVLLIAPVYFVVLKALKLA